MKFRQYIPVKASTAGENPDPAILCPANGYILDPSIPQELPEIINMPQPNIGEIILILTDDGDNHTNFNVTTASGQYRVKVIGANGAILKETTHNSNTSYTEYVPTGEGYVGNGYTYYFYIITAVSTSLTRLRALTRSGYDPDGMSCIGCVVNTTTLTTCDTIFSGMKKLKYCEFLQPLDACTTFYRGFYQASNIEILRMPSSLAVCTTVADICVATGNLKEFRLPESAPSLNTIVNMLLNSGFSGTLRFPSQLPSLVHATSALYNANKLKHLVFSTEVPLLQNLNNFAYGCAELLTATLPASLPSVTTLTGIFRYCYKLNTPIIFANAPNCTTIAYACEECYELPYLEFVGSYNSCTDIRNVALKGYKLKTLKLPTSLSSLITLSNTLGMADYCSQLTHLRLPNILNTSVPFVTPTVVMFGALIQCKNLVEITTVEQTHNSPMGIVNYRHLESLEVFDQPNLRLGDAASTLSLLDAGPTRKGKLSYFDVDFTYFKSALFLQHNNLSSSEILRISNKLPQAMVQSQFTDRAFSVAGNPGIDNLKVITTGTTGVNGNNIYTALIDIQEDVTGWHLQRYGHNYGNAFQINAATNTISVQNNIKHGFSNGREIYVQALPNGTNTINTNIPYYIVNATETEFQLSSTPGGTPIILNISGSISIVFKLIIQSFIPPRGLIIDCNVIAGGSNNTVLSKNFELYDLNKKGWRLVAH